MSFVAFGSSSMGKRELEGKDAFVFDSHCCNRMADVQRLALQRPHDPYCTGKSISLNELIAPQTWALPLGYSLSPACLPAPFILCLAQYCPQIWARSAAPLDLTLQRTPLSPCFIWNSAPEWDILGNEIPECLARMASNALSKPLQDLVLQVHLGLSAGAHIARPKERPRGAAYWECGWNSCVCWGRNPGWEEKGGLVGPVLTVLWIQE